MNDSILISVTVEGLVWFMVFNATFNNISVTVYHGGQFYWWKNRSIRRKQPTCRKSLTNFLRTPEFPLGF
jgi:hypothetical protein